MKLQKNHAIVYHEWPFLSFLYSKLCGFRQKWHSHSSTRDDEIRSNIFIPTISKGYHLERAAFTTPKEKILEVLVIRCILYPGTEARYVVDLADN